MKGRVVKGKSGKFVGNPHKLVPPKHQASDHAELHSNIPVDPTRTPLPIPGMRSGKRKS